MLNYVGLDVSLEETSICVMDGSGETVWRGKARSCPDAIARALERFAGVIERVVFESGCLSPWLWHGLRERGLPAVCIDARHAKNVLSLRLNKTDALDAAGLAQIARIGWYREVRVKDLTSHERRSLVVARDAVVRTRRDLGNQIRGLLKVFGLKVGKAGGARFAGRVRELLDERPSLGEIVLPLLALRQACDEQLKRLDRLLSRQAAQDPRCRLLISAPGVGLVVAQSYLAVIDDPSRFSRSDAVGAYLGLTPRRHQSGEVDYVGRISRRGDRLLRGHLFEAATVILSRLGRWCHLKAWGLKLAKRAGMKKARVAVARKLAVILHRMLVTGEAFRWQGKEDAA